MSVFLCVIDELPFATNLFVLTIYKFKITSSVLFIVSMTWMNINKSLKSFRTHYSTIMDSYFLLNSSLTLNFLFSHFTSLSNKFLSSR